MPPAGALVVLFLAWGLLMVAAIAFPEKL